MAFDVSGLSEYIGNNSKQIATQAVAGAATAQLLISNRAVQTGIKNREALLSMVPDVVFQDGTQCSRTSMGTQTLSDKFISVTPLKEVLDICPKDLRNTFYAYNLQPGQTPSEDLTPEFIRAVVDDRAATIASEVEKLLWIGDTSNTGLSANYQWIDGFGTIITGQTVSATGATIVEKFQTFYLAVPPEIREKADFRLFIGEDKYAEYLVALANKNVYKPTSDRTVFGTTMNFEVVPGLNGTGTVYGLRYSNMRLGLDGVSDQDRAIFRQSPLGDENYWIDFHFAVGVQVVFDSECYKASV